MTIGIARLADAPDYRAEGESGLITHLVMGHFRKRTAATAAAIRHYVGRKSEAHSAETCFLTKAADAVETPIFWRKTLRSSAPCTHVGANKLIERSTYFG
jgi:hypothetical protein